MKVKIDDTTKRLIDMLSKGSRQGVATLIMGLFATMTPDEQDWMFTHYFDKIRKDK